MYILLLHFTFNFLFIYFGVFKAGVHDIGPTVLDLVQFGSKYNYHFHPIHNTYFNSQKKILFNVIKNI